MSTIFASLDTDRSGTITLDELFRASFPEASEKILRKMVRYAHRFKPLASVVADTTLTPAQLKELDEIFQVRDAAHAVLLKQWGKQWGKQVA